MLFHCRWPERASLVIDAETEDDASALATETAEGEAPDRVRALPSRLFVVEVTEDDDGELWVEPLDHTLLALHALENEAPANVCGAVAEDDDGQPVTCELETHGPDVSHRATTPAGVLVWGNG